jgi:hypothetical protein
MYKWTILGIHGVGGGPLSANATAPKKVLRVRMFFGEEIRDEDFDVPTLTRGVTPSEEVYAGLIEETVEARMTALGLEMKQS